MKGLIWALEKELGFVSQCGSGGIPAEKTTLVKTQEDTVYNEQRGVFGVCVCGDECKGNMQFKTQANFVGQSFILLLIALGANSEGHESTKF